MAVVHGHPRSLHYLSRLQYLVGRTLSAPGRERRQAPLDAHPPRDPLAQDDLDPRRMGRDPEEGQLPARAIRQAEEPSGAEESHRRRRGLHAHSRLLHAPRRRRVPRSRRNLLAHRDTEETKKRLLRRLRDPVSSSKSKSPDPEAINDAKSTSFSLVARRPHAVPRVSCELDTTWYRAPDSPCSVPNSSASISRGNPRSRESADCGPGSSSRPSQFELIVR